MFDELSAWFSQSVANEAVQKWTKNGGKMVKRVVDADFLFSASPSAEDTKCLLEPNAKKRRVAHPITVLHPLYIEKCLSEQRIDNSSIFDFALPSEQLLPTVARQRGEKCPWLLELARSRIDNNKINNTSVPLSLDKHLGLKRKAGSASHTSSDHSITTDPTRCHAAVYGSQNSDSVALKDLALSKCQLRLLRLHGISTER